MANVYAISRPAQIFASDASDTPEFNELFAIDGDRNLQKDKKSTEYGFLASLAFGKKGKLGHMQELRSGVNINNLVVKHSPFVQREAGQKKAAKVAMAAKILQDVNGCASCAIAQYIQYEQAQLHGDEGEEDEQ